MPLTSVGLRARLAQIAKDGRGKPVRITDGNGLQLLVKPEGNATWVMRYRLDGRRRETGLGAYPEVTIAEARQAAEDARRLVRQGVDPVDSKRARRAASIDAARRDAAQSVTFKDAADATIAAKRDGWKSAKHAAQWEATLAQHIYPRLGSKPVAGINLEDVLAALRPIWTATPETASRVRQRLETIFDHATVRGWRSGENPARWRGHLSELLPPPRKVQRVTHHPALAWDQMPDFWNALAAEHGVGAMCLRFTILTACRSGEARGARWAEINLDTSVWTIPASRMKAGKMHRVPLPAGALATLDAALPLKRGDDSLVFPGRDGPISDMTLSAVLRRMNATDLGQPPAWRDAEGRAITVHGFRSTFKGWSLLNNFPDPLSELALAHTDKDKVRAAYARDDQLEQRRAMMDAWGAFCARKPATITAISDARRRRGGGDV